MTLQTRKLERRTELQLRLRNGFLRNRNQVLHCKVKRLQRKLDEAHLDTEKLEKEKKLHLSQVAVLHRRPPQFDPLSIPIMRLPVELRSIIQSEALHLNSPARVKDLKALLLMASPPLARKLEVPLQFRPQYVQTFLRTNAVDVDDLVSMEFSISRYERETGVNFWMNVRSLHLQLFSWQVQSANLRSRRARKARRTARQAIFQRCSNIKHLTIDLKIQLDSIQDVAQGTLKASGYQSTLETLCKLKTLHIAKTECDWEFDAVPMSASNVRLAKAACKSLVSAMKKAVLHTNPGCHVTEGPDPDWNRARS